MADVKRFQALGNTFGRSLKERPLTEANTLWTSFSEEDRTKAKHAFYAAAEAGHQAVLREAEEEKRKQKEKAKKEKEYVTGDGDKRLPREEA